MNGNGERVPTKRTLTVQQRSALNEVPPELEWLANIANDKTRRAYENDVGEFSAFMGIRCPAELRTIDWPEDRGQRREHTGITVQTGRRSSSKKNGPPASAVITPTGISACGNAVRATVSHTTRNAAPSRNPQGIRSR